MLKIHKMWGFPRGLGPWGGRWWWSRGLGLPWMGGARGYGPRWNGALRAVKPRAVGLDVKPHQASW